MFSRVMPNTADSTPYDPAFGRYLRYIRTEVYDEPLRDFANRLGISHGYLGRVELASVPSPSRETVISMADTLNLSRDDMLLRAGYAPESMDALKELELSAFSLKLRRLPADKQQLVIDFLDFLCTKYAE